MGRSDLANGPERRENALLTTSGKPSAGHFSKHTFHNVTMLCDRAADTAHYCTEQADLLADLPECGDECQALIRPLLPQPTR
jgi:hypothetical protein